MTRVPQLADAGVTAPADAGGVPYLVDISEDLDAFLTRWAGLVGTDPLPFHSVSWLRAWYGSFGASGGRRPVLVAVRHRATGADLMLLPLVSQRRGAWSMLEFVDASVVDYQLPLLAPDWSVGQAPAVAARQLWRALRAALHGYDVLRIEKMLLQALDESGAWPNPLALALPAQPCPMYGNQMHVGDSFDDWRHSLDKRVRKELERSWRVFTRSAEARFERLTETSQAIHVFEAMEAQQSQRMRAAGHRYVLDQAPYRRFYREALLAGLADGTVVLTCLRDGEHLVAALYGVANQRRFIALRLSTGGEAWSACSPGRLLLERTARHLHAGGARWFDFGIGEYAHKAVFNVERVSLLDAVEALSWRGVPVVWAWRARRRLKRQAWLVRLVQRIGRVVRKGE